MCFFFFLRGRGSVISSGILETTPALYSEDHMGNLNWALMHTKEGKSLNPYTILPVHGLGTFAIILTLIYVK